MPAYSLPQIIHRFKHGDNPGCILQAQTSFVLCRLYTAAVPMRPPSKQADRVWNLQAQTVSQCLLCAQDCADTTTPANYTHCLLFQLLRVIPVYKKINSLLRTHLARSYQNWFPIRMWDALYHVVVFPPHSGLVDLVRRKNKGKFSDNSHGECGVACTAPGLRDVQSARSSSHRSLRQAGCA